MARELVVRLVGDDQSLRRAFLRSSTGAKGFERDIGRASRGALAGSGAFRSFGRSIAFASGGFLAFASAGQFLRKSVDAAKEAEVTQRQLGIQLRNNGKSLAEYGGQIDKVDLKLSALSGFTKDQLDASLTTILRSTGNVSKALRDNATAADLARARHIGLAQAAFVIAKVEGGNTTLLRRQGFQIAKNATAEQALAIVRQKIAGQARAGATEQERFGAVLHDTEVIIGTGLLPTLNKYLVAGTKWLQQANESGKLQRDVATAADDVSKAVTGAADAVKTIDKVTGSFKNTLELLAAVKLATVARNIAGDFGLIGASAETARGRVAGLRGGLLGLNAISVAPIVIPIELHILNKERKAVTDKTGRLGKIGFDIAQAVAAGGTGHLGEDIAGLISKQQKKQAQPKPFPDVGFRSVDFGPAVASTQRAAAKITATQRNTFFDNAIARILLRGGLGSIQQQIAALRRADTLIAARIKITKDVTRRLKLEDELLQNAAAIHDLQAQQAADALQARQEARQRAIEAIQRRLAARTSHQFRELGLSATGDAVTPGVENLKKQLASLGARVAGTNLDTPKLQAQLARFRKVLSEGLVPKDVRAKIRDMLDGIRQELGKGSQNLTKSSHLSSAAFVNALGLNLTPDQKRRIEQVFSQVGAGGTVPGQRGLAFSGAGAQTIVVDATFQVDKNVLGRSLTKVQAKDSKRRTKSRRGTNAGR